MPTPAPRDKFWFILGREPLLAAAEIDAVLNLSEIRGVSPVFAHSLGKVHNHVGTFHSLISQINIANGILAAPTDRPPRELIKQLGGTIKIAKEIARAITEEKLKNIIEAELKKVEGKINFGLSFYSQTNIDLREIKKMGLEIKKVLKAEGYSVRYVENKEAALSSVTVEKNGLTGRGREFLIQRNHAAPQVRGGAVESNFSLAKTEAVQPFEEFSARDFGRPGRDDVSGMLPPKLAIIMINLAQAPKNNALLDPFCGSGTIISEALLLGYKNLIGADVSEKAIADSKMNIEWIKQKFSITNNQFSINFQISNVQNLSNVLKRNSIDTIITEPFLGKPLRGRETREELLKQAFELKKLYIESFKQFYRLLKPNGTVIFIIPRFKFRNGWITIDCQEEIEALGFKSVPFLGQYSHLSYARPDQRVGREIWRFEKT